MLTVPLNKYMGSYTILSGNGCVDYVS